jgi:hypothetical protein
MLEWIGIEILNSWSVRSLPQALNRSFGSVVDKSTATRIAATLLANQACRPAPITRTPSCATGSVVDGVTVEESSFNHAATAEHKSAENALVLHIPAIAERYAQEWQRLRAESEEMKARY